mmetsp:Transcript_42942/g.81898  ORF Transcript_42942/g.81898 Transcript_42942/m.81898 type:complete len:874 (+) Transcript_42942:317-2938(+)
MTRTRAPICQMWLLLLTVMVADAYYHPSRRCIELMPDREHRNVSNQLEFMDAILNPEVGCILFTNTIAFDHQTWGAEGPLFEGKLCVRFSWPFCAHQLLTHKVAVAPAHGLTADEAEWHLAPGMFYSTYLQFTGTGQLHVIGMTVVGMHDGSVGKLAMGRDIIAAKKLSLQWYQRPFISGNAIAESVLGYARCGDDFQATMIAFGLNARPEAFMNQEYDLNLPLGYVKLRLVHLTIDVESSYAVDDYTLTLKPYVNFTLANFTQQCCEAPKCLEEGCETHCTTPQRTQEERVGPVVYGGVEYVLVARTAERSRAEAECQSKYGSGLASFRSMSEFYAVTKALFTTDDGFTLMQLGLPLWVGNNQAEELAHHWIRRNASMSDPGNCTVVEIAQQLLDSYACDNFFPYICMRQVPSSTNPPPTPSPSTGPASDGTRGQSDDLFGVIPVELGATALVVLGLGALLVATRIVWRAVRRKPEEVKIWGQLNMTEAGTSVYSVRRRDVLRSPEIASIPTGLVVEGEHGVVTTQSIAAMMEQHRRRSHTQGDCSDGEGEGNGRRPSHGNRSVYSQHSGESVMKPKFPEIEGYEVIRALGAGTFGECYLARDLSSGELHAAKVPMKDDTLVKVVQEAYFLQMFNNNNIVNHRRTLVRTGKLVLLTEFCDCGDLHTLITAGSEPFGERFIRHVLLQCAMGLACMHSHHVAHRDVKPSNILLCSNGIFKLADLGASCMIVDSNHTTLVGTPLFMAPEVLSGEPQDVQTDVYSLGCVAYMLCMLKAPYDGCNLADISSNIHQSRYKQIPTDMYSPEFIELVERMLAKDASERPSAAEICHLDWLYDFCLNDFEQYQDEDGAFHQELRSRLGPGYATLTLPYLDC